VEVITEDEKLVIVTLIEIGSKNEERGRDKLAAAGQNMPAKTSAPP